MRLHRWVLALAGLVLTAIVAAPNAFAAEPVARFEWTMPDRYVDKTGDGYLDPTNEPVNAQAGYTVQFDACESTGGGRDVTSYKWVIEDQTRTTSKCTFSWVFQDEGPFSVKLTTTGPNGSDTVTHQVEVREFLVVSLGDSFGSGEGNGYETEYVVDVEVDNTEIRIPVGAKWEDKRCHRSAVAGPAQSARWLEKADTQTAVTFVALSCSGAKLVDPDLNDDVADGGLLDPYLGLEGPDDPLPWKDCKNKPFPLPARCPLAPQVDEIKRIIGDRKVDLLLISIGGNDMGFADIVVDCLIPAHNCSKGEGADIFKKNVDRLAPLYERLDGRLKANLGSQYDPKNTFITEYPDPTRDSDGTVCDPLVRTPVSPFVDMMSKEEASWASNTVVVRLNTEIQKAADEHKWNAVRGIARRLIGPPGHGMCAEDHWFARIEESFAMQGGRDGAFHPCAAGHGAYRDETVRAIKSKLKLTYPATVPGKDLVIGLECTSAPTYFLGDRDNDFVPDLLDNCPMVFNLGVPIPGFGISQPDEGNGKQEYTKDDGVGDACAGFTVNQSGLGGPDGDLKDEVCDLGSETKGTLQDKCTLRAAIEQANASGGGRITFNAGAGPETFSLTTGGARLPAVTKPTTFDATTQMMQSKLIPVVGKYLRVRCYVVMAHPCVEFNGGSATSGGINSGIRLVDGSFGSQIHHMAFNNFNGPGIEITCLVACDSPSAQNHRYIIQGNYIGTDMNGTKARPNRIGIAIFHSSGNIIGGRNPWERNVIAGNLSHGIDIGIGVLATRNLIINNFIGVDVTGVRALPNGGDGISLNSGKNQIGGPLPGMPNVISGNKLNGISIFGVEAGGNVIQGNKIGVAVDGTKAVPNGQHGVHVYSSGELGKKTVVGGTKPKEGNIIAFNKKDGVYLYSGYGHSVLGNSIHDNGSPGGLGIDIANCGVCVGDVTENDPLDLDSGINNMQNFPELTAVFAQDGKTTVRGTIKSNPLKQYRIEFFVNEGCDPSRHGEGHNFAGTTTVKTNIGGLAKFDEMLGFVIEDGQFVTATATHPDGSTSEFSVARSEDGPCVANLIVNSTGDQPDGDLADDRCDTGSEASGFSGLCTLRAAIQEANDSTGKDSIVFAVGRGPISIAPKSELPAITEAVTIDGTTQPGWVSKPIVELRGLLIPGGGFPNGLSIRGGDTTVLGFVINKFRGHGIYIDTAGGNVIMNNYIGTDPTGTLDRGNGGAGIWILSPKNLIGGPNGAGNLISGNAGFGVHIYDREATGNSIEGNLIGTDITGTKALGNDDGGVRTLAPKTSIGGVAAMARNIISANGISGIELGATDALIQGNLIGTDITGTKPLGNNRNGVTFGAGPNVVGGTTAGARNIISANGGYGVEVTTSVKGNHVLGNYIGTDVTGKVDLGNKRAGIYIAGQDTLIGARTAGGGNVIAGNGEDGIALYAAGAVIVNNDIGTQADGKTALGNTGNGITINTAGKTELGGTSAGTGNTIAFNKKNGVYISTGEGHAILGNVIYKNGTAKGLGIDLGDCATCSGDVTPNDAGDGDTGPNKRQNYPELATAVSKNSTVIAGVLKSAKNTTYRIEFFASDSCDGSGFGEGERYLGSKTVKTAANGQAAISATFSPAVATGDFVTATATDEDGNTSEFAKCVKVTKE